MTLEEKVIDAATSDMASNEGFISTDEVAASDGENLTEEAFAAEIFDEAAEEDNAVSLAAESSPAIKDEAARLQKLNPQMDEHLLMAVARDRLGQRESASALPTNRITSDDAMAQTLLTAEDAGEKAWLDFFRAYPDMRPQDIPLSVYKQFNEGENPIAALRGLRINELEAHLASMERNEVNRKKAMGSAKSQAAALGDDFLNGFYGN